MSLEQKIAAATTAVRSIATGIEAQTRLALPLLAASGMSLWDIASLTKSSSHCSADLRQCALRLEEDAKKWDAAKNSTPPSSEVDAPELQ